MHRFKAKHFPAHDGLLGLTIPIVIIHHQLIPLSLRGGLDSTITTLLKEFDTTRKELTSETPDLFN